jgi:tRNA pseudouridine38-40 synthase
MRVKLVIEYDGKNYSGWQRQENANSIQSEIEKAIFKLTEKNITIHGAGRTDADVHALGQVFHFDTDDLIPAENYAMALNTKMPLDIRAVSSCVADDDFHSRYDAKFKHYKYKIINRRRPLALDRHRAWHVVIPLDIDLMQKGAKHLLGTHDFATFMAAHSVIENTVRTIHEINISKTVDQITIDIIGNGFLRNMVRIIAGTLVNIGIGKNKPEDMTDIIKAKKRNTAGVTAPGYGLYLVSVGYDED